MILREAFTFIVITVLIFAFSGTLGKWLMRDANATCHEKNAALVYGPPQVCPFEE